MQTTGGVIETLERARTCPLCLNIDRVARPLERHLALRDDGLHESWFCRTCHATYIPPLRTDAEPRRFGDTALG
jgi:hypothetical protein